MAVTSSTKPPSNLPGRAPPANGERCRQSAPSPQSALCAGTFAGAAASAPGSTVPRPAPIGGRPGDSAHRPGAHPLRPDARPPAWVRSAPSPARHTGPAPAAAPFTGSPRGGRGSAAAPRSGGSDPPRLHPDTACPADSSGAAAGPPPPPTDPHPR